MTETDAMEKAKQELLAIHAQNRAAHFARDVNALMALQTDEFIYVGNGVIRHLTREEMRRNIEQAFKDATYFEFDDLEPPVVHVSSDGNLGWIIVRTKVRKAQMDETGTTNEREFVSASIGTYEKREGHWVRTATS